MAKLLEVKNLNVSFKIDAGSVLAVNGVSFSLEKGKVLGIVGESGSGKSVTAYSIMGILDKNGKVDEGKIIYNGTDLLRISEKDMRDIRGNKISIIFQDAMTSLNPLWSIGNQLVEAILIHAKDPVKDATSSYLNEIVSDKQRIASMEKGIRNHPERKILYEDKAKVEKKLIEDQKKYEEVLAKATKDYAEAEARCKEKIKKGKPAYNKKIKEAFQDYFKNFFKLAEAPSNEDAANTKKAHEYKNKASTLKKELEVAIKENQEFEEKYLKEARKNKDTATIIEAKARVLAARRIKHDYRKAELKYITYLRRYVYYVTHEPRIERWKKILQAINERYVFIEECKCEYHETKYSARKKALHMLDEVGITDPEKRLRQYPFELSGGMLQRCMIAMALVQRPDILIADEPTTALDVTIQAQILELLKKLQKEYGMAIIIITHDLGVIAQVCDEVDIMYAGRIVERGTVDDIFYNPQHEYTKGLLNSMPKLDTEKGRLESIAGNPVDLFCLPKGCAFSSRCKKCMKVCIDHYPEEISCDGKGGGHAASCWKVIENLQKKGIIDVINHKPEAKKKFVYNGAIRRDK